MISVPFRKGIDVLQHAIGLFVRPINVWAGERTNCISLYSAFEMLCVVIGSQEGTASNSIISKSTAGACVLLINIFYIPA